MAPPASQNVRLCVLPITCVAVGALLAASVFARLGNALAMCACLIAGVLAGWAVLPKSWACCTSLIVKLQTPAIIGFGLMGFPWDLSFSAALGAVISLAALKRASIPLYPDGMIAAMILAGMVVLVAPGVNSQSGKAAVAINSTMIDFGKIVFLDSLLLFVACGIQKRVARRGPEETP